MAEYYGSSLPADQFKCGNLPGKYFTLTDKTTGDIIVKRKGPKSGVSSGTTGVDLLVEKTMGTINVDTKKFVGDSSISTSEGTYFNSTEGTTAARNSAQTVTTKAIQAEEGGSYQAAVDKANKLFKTNKSATEESTGDSVASSVLNAAAAFFGAAAKGSRGSFPKALVFPPEIRSNSQDVIKFNMLEYVAKGLTGPSKESGGTGKFGPQDRPKNRKIVGDVTLPIPAGIQAQSQVDWGPNSMNVGQMQAAGITMNILGDKKEGDAIDSTIDAIGDGSDDVKKAIRSSLTSSATGANSSAVLSRTTGEVLNPNMELLFNAPSLRPFTFTFLLAPRSIAEANIIVKVLRFFKQGMSPIRSTSNLFLKPPNTFQLQYLHRNKSQHRFLNKFKECALQSCNINFTPNNNYSVYEDGSMQSYQLTMTFTELEPVFSDEYPNDGDKSLGY